MNDSTKPDKFLVSDIRGEQLVEGQWIETPLDGLTLVRDMQGTRLLRGDTEVGGDWRLWWNGKLYATWKRSGA